MAVMGIVVATRSTMPALRNSVDPRLMPRPITDYVGQVVKKGNDVTKYMTLSNSRYSGCKPHRILFLAGGSPQYAT